MPSGAGERGALDRRGPHHRPSHDAHTAGTQTGAAPAGSNGNGPAAGNGKPGWLLEDDRPVIFDVALHADTYSDEVTVVLSGSARDTITTHAGRVGHLVETGGVLVGLRPSIGEILITDAGSAGEGARRTRTSFRHDGLHDMRFIAELEQMTGGQLREVGSWHSHPVAGADRPSAGDQQSWVAVLAHSRRRAGHRHHRHARRHVRR